MIQRDWQKDMELCEKAFPGPWKVWEDDGDIKVQAAPEGPNIANFGRYGLGVMLEANFTAEARMALPYWLQEAKVYKQSYEAVLRYAGNVEAREQQLKPEIGKCMVAGNSLGSVIMSYNLPSGHEEWTFQQASAFFYETYERDTAYERYEIWLAWTAIMEVSRNLSTLYPDTPAPKEEWE
jgi:hypothetical protein